MRRALLLLLCCTCAFALNPELNLSQYAHRAWKVGDGFSKGSITSISQPPDGYLWLGSEYGLLRFDGVKAVPWEPSGDQQLPDSYVSHTLSARDGTLWIATRRGLASWKNGKLTQYPELAGRAVVSLLEDREGSMWVGANSPAILCELKAGKARCQGEDGSIGQGLYGLHEDRQGSLWVGVPNGLWRWKPRPPKFYSIPDKPNGIQGMVDTEDGDLLIAMRGAVKKLAGGKLETVYPFPATVRQFQAEKLIRDRDGGLWIGTTGGGVLHIHHGRTDVFRESDGLSSDQVSGFFEDREGSIWITSVNGLDRFHDMAAPLFTPHEGMSTVTVTSALGAKDGSVWFSSFDSVNRWSHGQFTVYREREGRVMTGVQEITGTGVPDRGLTSLFEDRRGRIWVAGRYGVGYLDHDRFVAIKKLPADIVLSMAEDKAGNLWLAYQNLGLYRLSPDNEVQGIPWAAVGHKDNALALARDPMQGGVWLGFREGGVAYFKDGQVRASYGPAEGLGGGYVRDFHVEPNGTVWAATGGGLGQLKNGRVTTLTSKNGLPCDGVQWITEDDDHSVWLETACGLVRIARSELDAWDANPNYKVRVLTLSNAQGIRSRRAPGGYSPHFGKSADGRLWFPTLNGASVIDPHHLPFNKIPPPVYVQQIIADRKTYNADTAQKLPALTRDLEIDYTALSFVAPESVHFRYKLEGHDGDWQDAGTRREAFYNDLPPRDYRFRVMAANNSGVWNETGASFDFSVAPAYYQSRWFQAACVAAFFAILWGLYYLRMKYVAKHLRIRMDERVNERTRIARDLHDTLLQSFQGVLLKFYAASYKVTDETARTELEGVIEQARSAIAEGRDAVQGLRASVTITNDLALAMGKVGQELAAHEHGTQFDLQVVGAPRNLVPLIRDEVYRIGCEALRNAFRHALAKRIELEIQYEPRRLQVRVRDNGKGMDSRVLKEGGRSGHHGLPGMQERARLVGGKLAVWSELDSGVEIELTIPGSVAYSREGNGHHSNSDGRRSSTV